jgi:hypothetical protein
MSEEEPYGAMIHGFKDARMSWCKDGTRMSGCKDVALRSKEGKLRRN